jgi:hypothetical protein
MKRIVLISLALVLVTALIATPVMAKGGRFSSCTRIQDGTLEYSAGHYLAGEPLKVGYDIFGYNYQARIFNGSYANVYLGGDGYPPYCGDDVAYRERLVEEGYTSAPFGKWYWPYRDVQLQMKWNDAWLSNMDCDGDGKLDRHRGFDSYIGSGAWITNHMRGEDEGEVWTYFTKIVAVPADAVLEGGIWYTADGTEIGPVIWGQFATIQQVLSGEGAVYVSPSGPGLGKW